MTAELAGLSFLCPKDDSAGDFIIDEKLFKVGGQDTLHSHLHIIPRFKDEPYAGKGIRHWLKQKENLRPR